MEYAVQHRPYPLACQFVRPHSTSVEHRLPCRFRRFFPLLDHPPFCSAKALLRDEVLCHYGAARSGLSDKDVYGEFYGVEEKALEKPLVARGLENNPQLKPSAASAGFRKIFLQRRFHDLLVIEVVDHHGRLAVLAADGVIVAEVRQTFVGAELAQVGVQFAPIGAAAFGVDLMVKTVQVGAVLVDPVEDAAFVVAAKVKVLQPNEVALALRPTDDGLHIGDAREDGRDEASGVDACFVELSHGLQSALDADGTVHLTAEVLVQGVD